MMLIYSFSYNSFNSDKKNQKQQQRFGVCLWEDFVVALINGQTVMGEKAWLSVIALMYPKCIVFD